MPSRTNTDLIRDLTVEIALHKERVAWLERLSTRLDTEMIRLDAEARSLAERSARAEAKSEALEKALEELKKTAEESDRKRWTLMVALVAALIAFIGNIAVSLLRKSP